MSTSRPYNSPVRRQKADETRQKIAAAARGLMIKQGFDGTTIDAIARAAGVSTQTVYAVFGSKRGIVAEIMDRARFGPAYREVVKKAKTSPDPEDRLRGAAGIARQIYDAERAEIDLLRGAGAVSADLAVLERDLEEKRFTSQAPLGEFLAASKRLRPGITVAMAMDIIWTLTGRENYRMMVVERGWTPAKYQAWLGDLLVTALLVKA